MKNAAGFSALQRTALARPDVSHLLILKCDRAARPEEVTESMHSKQELMQAGITIVFSDKVAGPHERGHADLTGDLLTYFDYYQSGDFLRKHAERVILCQRGLAARGLTTAGHPFYGFARVLVDAEGNVLGDPAATTLDIVDVDGDGLPDVWEMEKLGYLMYSQDDDPDGDGASNLVEYQYGTDPFDIDTDIDSMPDGWEIAFGLDPLDDSDGGEDSDGDCFSNLAEYQGGAHPLDPASYPTDCNDNCVWDAQEPIGGGDFDADSDVDLVDFAGFAECMAAPGGMPSPAEPACTETCRSAFDSDSDADVDLADFAGFQQMFGV